MEPPEIAVLFVILFYKQKCSITISYTPGSAPPDLDLVFNFKTLLGGDVSFTARVGRPSILSDFYLSSAASFASELVFDNLGLSGASKDLTVTNYGNVADLTGIVYSITGRDADEFTLTTTGSGDCTPSQTLAMNGGQCALRIIYKPKRSGLKSAELSFASTNGYSHHYAITAVGLQLTASSPTLSFQPAAPSGSSQDLTVTLTNPPTTVASPPSLAPLRRPGGSAFCVVTNSCGSTINAGVSCPITIRYTPAASAHWESADLTISCDSRGGQLTIPLYAETVTAQLLADTSLVDFGEVAIGSSALRAVTLTNSSSTKAIVNLATALTALQGTGLSVSGTTCGSVVAASSDFGGLDRPVVIKGRALQVRANFTTVDFGSVMNGLDRNGSEITVWNPSLTDTFSGCSLDSSSLNAAGFSLLSTGTCQTTTSLAP